MDANESRIRNVSESMVKRQILLEARKVAESAGYCGNMVSNTKNLDCMHVI